jgi:hypothetical protein
MYLERPVPTGRFGYNLKLVRLSSYDDQMTHSHTAVASLLPAKLRMIQNHALNPREVFGRRTHSIRRMRACPAR